MPLLSTTWGCCKGPSTFSQKDKKPRQNSFVFSETCNAKFNWAVRFKKKTGTKQEWPVESKQEFRFLRQQRGHRRRGGFAVAGLHKCVRGESFDIFK